MTENHAPRPELTEEMIAEFDRVNVIRTIALTGQLTANMAKNTDTVIYTEPGLGTTSALAKAAQQLNQPIAIVHCALVEDALHVRTQARHVADALGGPDAQGGIIVFDEFSRISPRVAALIADAFSDLAKHGIPASAHRVWIKQDITVG